MPDRSGFALVPVPCSGRDGHCSTSIAQALGLRRRRIFAGLPRHVIGSNLRRQPQLGPLKVVVSENSAQAGHGRIAVVSPDGTAFPAREIFEIAQFG
jgi:hypothetical protein